MRIAGCKVFSATKHRERNELGERVTEWIRAHPELTITETIVRQSSDSEYHCISIVLFHEQRTRRTR